MSQFFKTFSSFLKILRFINIIGIILLSISVIFVTCALFIFQNQLPIVVQSGYILIEAHTTTIKLSIICSVLMVIVSFVYLVMISKFLKQWSHLLLEFHNNDKYFTQNNLEILKHTYNSCLAICVIRFILDVFSFSVENNHASFELDFSDLSIGVLILVILFYKTAVFLFEKAVQLQMEKENNLLQESVE